MRSVAVFLVALTSSAFALRITYPGLSDTWTTLGPNQVRWESVSTDPTSFQVVLSTPTLQRTVLAETIQTSQGSLVVTSPAGGFTAGTAYRVNLISIDNGGILAESAQFNITAGSGTVSATGSATGTTATGTATGTVATTARTTTPAGGSTTGAGATGSTIPPPAAPSSGASPAFKASGALLGALSAVYAFLL